MQVEDACCEDLTAHLNYQALPNLFDFGIISLDRLKSSCPVWRNMTFCPGGPTQESSVGVDGHDARDDRHRNAFRSNFLYPVEENVDIVEHLSDNECSSGIDLFLEVVKQEFCVWLVVTALRVASNTDVEVTAVSVFDVLDQVACVTEAASSLLPLFLVSRRIASEGKDVGAASVVRLSQCLVKLGLFHVGACKVHTRLQTICRLGNLNHLTREVAQTATGTPRDIDERWSEVVHTIHAVVEVLNSLHGLGREEFERKRRPALLVRVLELLRDVHLVERSNL